MKQMKFESKIGTMYLVASEESLFGVFWKRQNVPFGKSAFLDKVEKQISEYLTGKRKSFDLPFTPEGTEFQKRVWKELLKIPYGETRSYKQIATILKDPNASRAVGTANGQNPISIIIPCHRVIASSGALAGYAGGLPKKKMLLELEEG